MREAVGRVVFFDAIAEGLLQLHPGPIPKIVALFVRGALEDEDQISLAEAVCRLCAKSSSHIHVRCLDELGDLKETNSLVIKARGEKTSDVLNFFELSQNSDRVIIIIEYCRNDTRTAIEIIFDAQADRMLVEQAIRKLFDVAGVAYESLAPFRYDKGGFRSLARSFDLFDEPATIDWNDPKVLETFCYNVSQSWQYGGKRVDGEDVYNWVMQFHASGFEREACQLLLYLKREGFTTVLAVVENVRRLYQNYVRNLALAPLAVSIQHPGKSELFLAYPLSPEIKLHTIEEALLITKKNTETINLVCIDDVIVSGQSILDFLFDPGKNKVAHDLIEAFENKSLTLTVLVSHADEKGIEAIKSDPRGHGAIDVKAEKIIDDFCRVFHENGMILSQVSQVSQIEKFKSFCEIVGGKIYKKNPLGWNNAQWCIVLDYSVPNGTLPIFFAHSRRFDWKPLFPRLRTSSTKVEM